MYKGMIAGAVLTVCFLFGWNAGADILKDPALVRFYTFQEVTDNKVKNLAGDGGELVFVDLKARKGEPFAEELQVVPGRLPETKAVRINSCSLRDMGYRNQESGVFTFACWVKMLGYGELQINDTGGGTIASVRSGYYDGWRITVGGPDRQIHFQIGGRKPEGGSYLRSAGTLALDKWQHVAVTWDGRRKSVYVDGKLSGEKEYAGDYVDENCLMIGYAGAGVGSLDMEIDEAAIYSRALTAEEIVRLFESGVRQICWSWSLGRLWL